ncbi:MAG: metal-sensing transcriptional repressor [Capsulimonadaceae bacterium]
MSRREGPAYEDVGKRLARIAGHAASLKRFWEEGRDTEDLLTQISAVRAALDQVARVVLEHQIEHSIKKAIQHGDCDEALKDLKKALNRLI